MSAASGAAGVAVAPHVPQNFQPSPTSAPQFGHVDILRPFPLTALTAHSTGFAAGSPGTRREYMLPKGPIDRHSGRLDRRSVEAGGGDQTLIATRPHRQSHIDRGALVGFITQPTQWRVAAGAPARGLDGRGQLTAAFLCQVLHEDR